MEKLEKRRPGKIWSWLGDTSQWEWLLQKTEWLWENRSRLGRAVNALAAVGAGVVGGLSGVHPALWIPLALVAFALVAFGLERFQRFKHYKAMQSEADDYSQSKEVDPPINLTWSDWKDHRDALKHYLEKGQSIADAAWPSPDLDDAYSAFTTWERQTVAYLRENLGSSYADEFLGGDERAHGVQDKLSSSAQLRLLFDSRLENLTAIIWTFRGPAARVRVEHVNRGDAYLLGFHNRTGDARMFEAQVSIIRRTVHIENMRVGITYTAMWQGSGGPEAELADGEHDYIVLAERQTVGRGDGREMRLGFPWKTVDGASVHAVTERWKRGEPKQPRVKVRVVVSARPSYEGGPFRGCYRIKLLDFGPTHC